jgi:putative membrane protein
LDLPRKTTFSRWLSRQARAGQLLLAGFLMGSADVVPGVSGGTVAFLLGIYDELLEAIHTSSEAGVKLATLRLRAGLQSMPWKFILPLGAGIMLAIFSLARLLDWLLTNQPTLVWSFFFGLVLASSLVVARRLGHWQPRHYAIALAFAAGIYWLIGQVPLQTAHTPPYFLLSGALAVTAMILPGISGAFILVLLGKYAAVLEAVVNFDLITLGLVAAGAVIGLLSLARLLRWLLARYRAATTAALVGLMLGSLRKLWPWKAGGSSADEHALVAELNVLPATLDGEVLFAFGLALAACLLVLGLEQVSRRREVAA